MNAIVNLQSSEQVGPALPSEGPVVDIIVQSGRIYVDQVDEHTGQLETLVLMENAWVVLEAGHA